MAWRPSTRGRSCGPPGSPDRCSSSCRPTRRCSPSSSGSVSRRRWATLYGGSPGDGFPEPRPVVSIRARVLAVRRLAAGESVSYNALWRAGGATTVATLGIGYADGVRRALGLSGQGAVMLRGRRCPIVGAVTMDLTMVETGDQAVEVG